MTGSTHYCGRWCPSAAVAAVAERAARAYGFAAPELASTGRVRPRPVARARQAAAWAIRARWPRLTLGQVGRAVGGIDGSSAYYALLAAERLRLCDMAFHALTEALVSGAPCEAPAPLPPSALPVPWTEARRCKPVNTLDPDDSDARERRLASLAFIEVLRAAHPERVKEMA